MPKGISEGSSPRRDVEHVRGPYQGEAGQVRESHIPHRARGTGEVPVEEPSERAPVPGSMVGRHGTVSDDQAGDASLQQTWSLTYSCIPRRPRGQLARAEAEALFVYRVSIGCEYGVHVLHL